MIELAINDFKKVSQLVDRVSFNNYFAQVVIEGKVEGKIFADNETSPRVCLVIHKYGMALLCGDTDIESFNEPLVSLLKNRIYRPGCAKWILINPEDEWKVKLKELLGDDLIVRHDVDEGEISGYKKSSKILETLRANFKFHENLYNPEYALPEGFRLERINHDIYRRISGSVVPEYYWRSRDDFLTNGAGYSMISDNGDIASICFTSFIVADKYEFGVETFPDFRGKGYGIIPVKGMIDFCLKNKYEPVWGCRKENAASFKLAEKAGFRVNSLHPYYTLPAI